MARGPAQELLRAVAAAPQRQKLWRESLAALPEADDVLEMVATDALRRHFGHHGPVPVQLSAGLQGRSLRLVQAAKAWPAFQALKRGPKR